MSSSPFGPGDRASGILLHVTSLPSPYGIGDLGPSAFAWVDRLARSGQSWWQALPLGPTGYGDSPYQSLSSFAGNILLISPDGLIARRPPPPGRAGGAGVPDGRGRLSGRHPIQAPTARAGVVALPGGGGRGPAARLRAILPRPGPLAGRLRPVPGPEDPPRRRALPRLARAARPARPGGPRRGAARAGRPHRPGPLRPVPVGPPGRPPPGLRPHARGPPHRRPADLRLARLGRRVGRPAALPARRAAPAPARRGRAARLLQPRRASSGATRSTTGRPSAGRDTAGGSTGCARLLAHVDLVRLDHFRGFAAAWHVPAGAATAREGRWVPGPGRGPLPGRPGGAGRPAAHRRGPGHHHARRPPAPRATCTSRG